MGWMHVFMRSVVSFRVFVLVNVLVDAVAMLVSVLVFVLVFVHMDFISVTVFMCVLVGVFVGMQMFVFMSAFHPQALLSWEVVALLNSISLKIAHARCVVKPGSPEEPGSFQGVSRKDKEKNRAAHALAMRRISTKTFHGKKAGLLSRTRLFWKIFEISAGTFTLAKPLPTFFNFFDFHDNSLLS